MSQQCSLEAAALGAPYKGRPLDLSTPELRDYIGTSRDGIKQLDLTSPSSLCVAC